jgi:uncharacterized protein
MPARTKLAVVPTRGSGPVERVVASAHFADLPEVPTLAGPVKLLVLQGTPFCNIDCSYCYLPDRDSKAKMSAETVRGIVQRLREDGLLRGTLLVNWHAGEPLVLPPSFYEERIPLFQPLVDDGIAVTHSLQTNGMLVTDAFCDLFRKLDIKIGVSVDGPAFLHDSRRVTRSGKPTHVSVMAGIRKLQSQKIPFNAICVLSDQSLRYPDEIYAWFRSAGIRAVGFNLEEIEGANLHSSIVEVGFNERYVQFLERFWTLVEADGRALRVREFDDAEGRILDHNPRRNSQTDPLINLTVAANGDFSTFCPELLGTSFPGYPNFALGNVHETGLRDSLRTPSFLRLWQQIRVGVEACRAECAHFEVCGGGNPSNKIAENGSFATTRTRNCSNRIIATCDFVIGKIEQRIEQKDRAASR